MASAIDGTQPAYGSDGDSAPIRNNFATAKAEITALQASVAALQLNAIDNYTTHVMQGIQ